MKISRTITVSNNTAYIDAPIYLYKGDGDVLISLDIINITISTKLNKMSTTNYINDNISYATACLCKRDSSSTFHIVGTKVNDKIELELKKDMMNETVEVGEYIMQVHLFDDENNRLTIPIVEEINIILPLCDDGYVPPPIAYSSKIGEATVGYSKVVTESMSTSSDFYNTYNWTTGEYITANKLNNMITGIDEALYDIKNIQNNYVTKSELNNKANKNEIPTKMSQLLNDKGYLTEHQDLSNYATKSYVDSEIVNAQLGGDANINLSEYATKDELNEKANKNDVPTKVSQLTNDKGYLTSIPSEYITETELNNKGYLTQHQSLDNYATKSYVSSEIAKAQLEGGEVDLDPYALKEDIPTKLSELQNDENFLTSIPSEYITETELNNKDFATKDELNAKADIDDIPTKISDLQNDMNFISSIPSEYVTETELEQKGYLTNHQDISHLASKSELHSHNNKTVLDGITSVKVSSWDNKSDFDGNYNNLINKPTIPSLNGYATESYVKNEIAKVHPQSPYYGKKAVFLGDSQTEYNNHKTKVYYSWVQEILGLSSIKQYGIGGTSIAKKNETDNTAMCVRYINMDEDADLIFVMGGVNDVWFNTQLGTMGDTNPLTFYGAMDTLCKGLYNKYPTKLIVFITPTEQNNENCISSNTIGTCVSDYANAMRRVCVKYGIRVFDAHAILGIYPYIEANSSYYTTDGLHFNDTAQEKLGRELCKYLLSGTQSVMYLIGDESNNTPEQEPDVPEIPDTPDEPEVPNEPLWNIVYTPTEQSDAIHFSIVINKNDYIVGKTAEFNMNVVNWSGSPKTTMTTGGGIFTANTSELDGTLVAGSSLPNLILDGTVVDGEGLLSKTFTTPNLSLTPSYVKFAFSLTNIPLGQSVSFDITNISLKINGNSVEILNLGGFFPKEGCVVTKY